MKIFISHSSKDKMVIDYFVEKILILGCGINEDEIFCTSIEGLGIKTGLDFREHIKSKLLNSDYSFLFISNNYKNSDICLNEMGASWAQDSVQVKPFIFPDINFNSIGTLYSVKQVAKINDSSSLDELFEEISNKYTIQKKISRWNKNKNDFLDFIKSYNEKLTDNNPKTEYDFFKQFIQKNASLNHLLLKCHPNLLDCKKIFNEKYYLRYFEAYCKSFNLINENSAEPLYEKYKSFRVSKIKLSDKNKLTGGMNELVGKGVFNYDVVFYRIEFLKEENSQHGLSYNYFCYLNNRWVFFPKPWRF